MLCEIPFRASAGLFPAFITLFILMTITVDAMRNIACCYGLFILFSIVMLYSGCQTASYALVDTAAEEDAIRQVLSQQVAAWNEGNLEGFMEGYARTDTLRFASGGTVRYGWQATLDGYRRGYPDRAAMGTLSFDLRDIQVLSPEWALVFGAWALERSEDRPAGLFTLTLRKTAAGWRVVQDHTSSE